MYGNMSEYELESLLAGEYESENEWESQLEGDFEGGDGKSPPAPNPGWKKIATNSAREVLVQGLPAAGAALGAVAGRKLRVGPAASAVMGQSLGAALGGGLASLLPRDNEFEFELELEGEVEHNQQQYTDALMEHLGYAAARAESEAEAEAFIGALLPLAAQLIPQVAPAIMRAAPNLISGLAAATKNLRRSPSTRPLVQTIPTIVRRTAASMNQQRVRGVPMTPQTAVRSLAKHTYGVLSSPQQAKQALRRSRAVNQRYQHEILPEDRELEGAELERGGGKRRGGSKAGVAWRELARDMAFNPNAYGPFNNSEKKLPPATSSQYYIEGTVPIGTALGTGQYRVVCLVDTVSGIPKVIRKYWSRTHYGTGADAGKGPAFQEFW
ncbi:MAG: hypothetical protein WCD53_06615 [Microcoleus sp.]